MTAISETMKLLPPEAKREVRHFAEFLAQKYLKKQKSNGAKNKIMSFAGAWKDLSDNDFQDLIDDVYQRREKSFSRRGKI